MVSATWLSMQPTRSCWGPPITPTTERSTRSRPTLPRPDVEKPDAGLARGPIPITNDAKLRSVLLAIMATSISTTLHRGATLTTRCLGGFHG